MIYLESFYLPSFEEESSYLYPTRYPFGIFSKGGFCDIHFANITIFYGGNGSGKSTLLNIINSKLKLVRKSVFYKDEAYDAYVLKCKYKLAISNQKKNMIPENSQMIASEDIIDFVFSIRNKNLETTTKQKELSEEYDKAKYGQYKFGGLDDYDVLTRKAEALTKTKTKYINSRTEYLKQFSNGESALRYFDTEFKNDGVYLLDEPENCLSAQFQIELVKLIIECSRYCDCQFIIATHSPFLLSLPGAKIYNLDLNPVDTSKWTELENVRIYYEFFKQRNNQFNDYD